MYKQMDLSSIFQSDDITSVIAELKKKSIVVPSWAQLEKEYKPKKHPVFTDKSYTDEQSKSGRVVKVSRIGLGWQKLAVKRMTEMLFSIPVKRIYKPKNDQEKRVGEIMEDIFSKNRINSVNTERGVMLNASCEVITIWYSQEAETYYAGEQSGLKLRCKNYSPMKGDALFPLFDEYDDLIALSIEYVRQEGDSSIKYFDTYTSDRHIRFAHRDGVWTIDAEEGITLGKIAGVYINRSEPIWEDQSENVYELEWSLSRSGNYIRKNSRPNWVVFSDDDIVFGGESDKDSSSRNVLKYPSNARAQYVTWEQAIESLKFQFETLKQNFFMQLQLPDMSMENMKATPMSGEARKMMFIDAQLKVKDESGVWLEAFDREINVVRAFMKIMFPSLSTAIDSLQIEIEITPFVISAEGEMIQNLTSATAGKPIMSQKTAIENLGWVDDADAEMKRIAEESQSDIFEESVM